MDHIFFFVFLITIILTRIVLYFHPTSSPTFVKFRLHHYMYGIVLIIFGLIFHKLLLYGIGWGLFIDELTYLLIRGKTHADNYSTASLIGTIIFMIIIFILKSNLVSIFLKT